MGRKLPEGWISKVFDNILLPSKEKLIIVPRKLKTIEYKSEGKYPIIDQGEKFIAGYTDDLNDCVKIKDPLVVFGDHSKTVKYIDFNFAVGADGLVIFQHKKDLISSKLLYYITVFLVYKYENKKGYKRYSSDIKKENIFFPTSPTEQQKIVDYLDKQFAFIDNMEKEINTYESKLNELEKGILEEAFSGLEKNKIELSNFIIKHNNINKDYENHDFKYIDISSIDNKTKSIILSEVKDYSIENAPSRAKRIVKSNDILISTTRPNLNAVTIVPNILDNQITSTGICILRINEKLEKKLFYKYLFYFTRSKIFIDSLDSITKGALYPAVRDDDVYSQKILYKSYDEQKSIAYKLDKQFDLINSTRQEIIKQKENLKELRKAMLNDIFGGFE